MAISRVVVLRFLLVLQVALVIGSAFIPTPASHAASDLDDIQGAVTILAIFVASVGLWFVRRWARWVYAACLIASLLPFANEPGGTMASSIVDTALNLTNGVTLGLVVFGMAPDFAGRRALERTPDVFK